MPIFLLGLLGLLGVGFAVATRKSAAPGYGQTTPTTQPAQTPGTVPMQTPGTLPTNQELVYFDIRADGTRVWKEPYRSQLINQLFQWGVAFYAANDATTVQLVPRRAQTDATAAAWAEQFSKTRHILAGRWLMLPDAQLPPGTPKYLRAVPPGEELTWAGTGQAAIYAVLIWSQAVQPQPAPQQQQPAPPQQSLPPPPPPPVQPDAFTPLPSKLADEARRSMRDERDPERLIQIADAIEGSAPNDGAYAEAADALRKRAKELRTEIEVKAITQNRTHVLRKTTGGHVELASNLAQYYTGNANSWRDLVATNKHVGMRIMKGEGPDNQKIEYLFPWKVGQRVILPPSWDTSKGLPPLA